MKLSDPDTIAYTRGTQQKTSFTIAASPNAFKVLSGGYKNNKKAIIRELSTNAIDAHIEAGTLDRPFVVTLPTMNNLNFCIRDFGTGMCHEKINTLYTTYFASDKTDSNEFTGCLGLGSKSPFSYVNSFTVTSYYNGRKSIYIAMKGATGYPEINLMHREDTDEHNGMEISFTVKADDIDSFEENASEVYKFFKYPPILNGKQLKFELPKYLLQGNGWGLIGTRQYGYNEAERSFVTMGNIAYPIESSQLNDTALKSNSLIPPNAPKRYQHYSGLNEWQALLNLGLHIELEIGDVEMTPYREDLQYETKTIVTLKNRLGAILKEITETFNKRFSDCKNLWEARKLYSELHKGELRNLQEVFELSPVTYKGEKLSCQIEARAYGGTPNNIPGTTVLGLRSGNKGVSLLKDKNFTTLAMPYNQNTRLVFFEQDMERGSHVAVRRYVLEPENHRVQTYLLKFEDATAKQKFCDLMGFDDSYLIKTSTLPKTVRAAGPARVTRDKAKVVSLIQDKYINTRNPHDFWTPVVVDINKGGVYVEINQYHCRNNGNMSDVRTLVEIVQKMQKAGITLSQDIIGVKTSIIEKFNGKKQWVSVTKYLTDQLESFLKTKNYQETIGKVKTIQNFVQGSKYTKLMQTSTETCKSTEFIKFVADIKDLQDLQKNNQEKARLLLDAATTLRYNINVTQSKELERQETILLNKYKILSIMDDYKVNQKQYANVVMQLINDVVV